MTTDDFDIMDIIDAQAEYERKKPKPAPLTMIEQSDFDIVLMDINMPVMDGIECTEKIRNLDDEIKSKIPIIAITGNARNLSLEEYQEIGINEFLQKPLNFDQLVTLVKELTAD